MLLDRRPVEQIVADPYVVQTLFLISRGVPFDVAWSLPMTQAKAWAIILREFEGDKVWDFATGQFVKREAEPD